MNLTSLSLAIYVVLFSAFSVIVGRLLRVHGRVFLSEFFGSDSPATRSIAVLLDLGFVLLAISMLLLNLGTRPELDAPSDWWVAATDVSTSVFIRLGISILTVAVFHALNILVLSILSQRRR